MGGYLLPSDGDLDSDARYNVRILFDGGWKVNDMNEGGEREKVVKARKWERVNVKGRSTAEDPVCEGNRQGEVEGSM